MDNLGEGLHFVYTVTEAQNFMGFIYQTESVESEIYIRLIYHL